MSPPFPDLLVCGVHCTWMTAHDLFHSILTTGILPAYASR
jgi:hypothetical protein